MKRFPAFFGIMLLLLARLITLSSCANIIPPSGGPRDSLPPRLVMSNPKDSATNVNVRNITLTFDEFVTLQSVQQNMIVSPNVKNTPFVDAKLRVITIRMRDSLEANTTYSFDFGDAIKDVNEGNIAKNFVYAFSTGKTLDNYTYGGKVVLAETGRFDSTLIVVLHRNPADSAVFKLQPRYYTRVTGKGEFLFKHLPAGKFYVYAVPQSFLNTYSDSTKPFAFRGDPVVIGADTKKDSLFAYAALKGKPAQPANNSITVTPKPKEREKEKEDKRLRYSFATDNGRQDLLSDAVFIFNRKLGNFDSTKFVLYDTNYNRLPNYHVTLDTGKTQLILKYPWKQDVALRIVIAKDAVADSAGVTLLRSDTLRIMTKTETDYGSLRLRFSNLDFSRHPVLQIVQNDKVLESVPLVTAEFRRQLFRPGSYELRILYDTNQNGVWDPGNFAKKLQPETIFLVPKQIAVRGNWDNEINLSL